MYAHSALLKLIAMVLFPVSIPQLKHIAVCGLKTAWELVRLPPVQYTIIHMGNFSLVANCSIQIAMYII